MATKQVFRQVGTMALWFVWVNVAAGNILYVDIDRPREPFHDGSSWENAITWLQDALELAVDGDEIRVAEGSYRPDQTGSILVGDWRTLTFHLKNGVTLEGGYAGYGEPDPDQRDIAAYESILTGDIGTPGDSSDNCYHVVTGSGTGATAVLDGFTLTGGNASELFDWNHTGGGMWNDNGSPTVVNCTFRENTAWGDGAGMSNYHSSNATVDNCRFTDNLVLVNGGGGIANVFSAPVISNCTFINNSAYYGGAMHSSGGSTPTLINCVFMGNQAQDDAGAVNNNGSNATVTNCTFHGNSARCVGGMRNINCHPIVTNCIFWENTDTVHSSDDEWGQIDGNTGWMTINYSCIQGWTGSPDPAGVGNIADDPLFAGDCRLSAGSPCIDAGDNSAPGMADTDIEGNPRIIGPAADMGAYEFQAPLEHAAAETEQLAEKLETLDLPAGTANSLASKLENAVASIEQGQTNAAINKLEAFIHEVEAQRGKKIVEAEADALIAAAQAIIVLLLSL